MTAPVVRAIGHVPGGRTNADLIAESAVLGHLYPHWQICDPTWGKGRFWSVWRPRRPGRLIGSDLNPKKSPAGRSIDFTDTPYSTDRFDAAVLDGPYKLNGTSTGAGPSASDEDYGVEQYLSPAKRHALISAGIVEMNRIVHANGVVMVKCQDQVAGGVHWQTDIFTRQAEALGMRKVDALLLPGMRDQPSERTKKCPKCKGSTIGCPGCVKGRVPTVQHHARRDYSTLLIFRTAKR